MNKSHVKPVVICLEWAVAAVAGHTTTTISIVDAPNYTQPTKLKKQPQQRAHMHNTHTHTLVELVLFSSNRPLLAISLASADQNTAYLFR